MGLDVWQALLGACCQLGTVPQFHCGFKMRAGSGFIRWEELQAKHLNRHEWTPGQDRVGSNTAKPGAGKYELAPGLLQRTFCYQAQQMRIQSLWMGHYQQRVVHPITDHIYNRIINLIEYLQLHNCKTVPQEFGSSAYCKELYCNK